MEAVEERQPNRAERRAGASNSPNPRGSWSRIEFCERHDLSLGMFHKLVGDKRLRAKKIGAKTVVTAEDEAAWLASLPDAA